MALLVGALTVAAVLVMREEHRADVKRRIDGRILRPGQPALSFENEELQTLRGRLEGDEVLLVLPLPHFVLTTDWLSPGDEVAITATWRDRRVTEYVAEGARVLAIHRASPWDVGGVSKPAVRVAVAVPPGAVRDCTRAVRAADIDFVLTRRAKADGGEK